MSLSTALIVSSVIFFICIVAAILCITGFILDDIRYGSKVEDWLDRKKVIIFFAILFILFASWFTSVSCYKAKEAGITDEAVEYCVENTPLSWIEVVDYLRISVNHGIDLDVAVDILTHK